MSDRTVDHLPAPPFLAEHDSKARGRSSVRVVKRGTISYHTFDAGNLDTMRTLAEMHGLHVEHREPRDGLACGPALLIDADFWWSDRAERQRGLLALVQREVRLPVVAVHGWQLDDEQIAWLKQHGFHVGNQLDDEFVEELAKRIASIPPVF